MHTAESVTPMHPDKICDRISDSFLDACLAQDPDSRVAIEVMGGHGIITVTGELTTKAEIDPEDIVRKVVGTKYRINVNIVKQSPEIAQGVDTGGAGDQGIMIGYACDDNEFFLPQEYYLARDLCRSLYERFPFDGKTQVTINDDKEILTVVASFQNVPGSELHTYIEEWLNKHTKVLPGVKIYANPAGDWSQGGFDADTGLTGRKLMVDNYGPRIAIGGGAFSGKDATKVDRSGAYMARRIAVDILKKNHMKEVTVRLAYAIGLPDPVMAKAIVKDKENRVSTIDITNLEKLTPRDLIERLDLKVPKFAKTAEWGHFGNGFSWDD